MCLQIKIAVWVNYCQIKFINWFYASVEFTVTVSNNELQINKKKNPPISLYKYWNNMQAFGHIFTFSASSQSEFMIPFDPAQ